MDEAIRAGLCTYVCAYRTILKLFSFIITSQDLDYIHISLFHRNHHFLFCMRFFHYSSQYPSHPINLPFIAFTLSIQFYHSEVYTTSNLTVGKGKMTNNSVSFQVKIDTLKQLYILKIVIFMYIYLITMQTQPLMYRADIYIETVFYVLKGRYQALLY